MTDITSQPTADPAEGLHDDIADHLADANTQLCDLDGDDLGAAAVEALADHLVARGWRRPLPLDEATWTDCPTGELGTASRPWRWSDPIEAIVGDSYKFRTLDLSDHEQGLAVWRGVIRNLYSQGFALVRVDGSPGAEAPGDATPLPALRGEASDG